nr:YcaO-like family protein [Streptomyces taklimakanensis]
MAAGRHADRRPGEALTPRVVGAYGHSRTDTLARGVGEAVERYALFPEGGAPPGAVRGTLRELGSRALPFHRPDVALGDPDAVDEPLTWYPARRLRDDGEVLVPAPLVDYPDHSAEAGAFDPSPSGAASGQGAEMALRSALLETVERDAFTVAWERRLRLPRVRVDLDAAGDVPGGKENARRRSLRALWRKAEQAGLVPLVADLPTGLPGITCSVGVVLDEKRPAPLATVGCNATDDPWWSMLGALQEALQIRSVVVNSWDDRERGRAPAVIANDDDRLRYVASEDGHRCVSEWVEGFTGTREPRPRVQVPTEEIVRYLVEDGADPVAVDLTHRLPAPLREMGWAAMKVITVGYQPLRLVEDHPFTWNAHRLRTAQARTGCPAGPASRCPSRPHPLP